MQNKAAVQLLTQSQVSQSIREGSIPSQVQSRLAASRCWHGAPVEISTFGEDRIGVISYCSSSFHSYHLLQLLGQGPSMCPPGWDQRNWPWTCFPEVHLRHMRAVNKDNVASRCGEKNKKPRQIKLGNMDLIFSFPLLLLEIGQRHKKRNGPKIWEMMDHQAQIPALSLSAYSRTFHKHLYKKPGKSFTWCLPTCLGSPNPEVINEAPWALTLYESG